MSLSRASKGAAVAAVVVLTGVTLPQPAAAARRCAGRARAYGSVPKGSELEAIRSLVHSVARQEGVDPYLLEAIGRTETGLRPALGTSCEIGHFQIMPFWARTFGLASPDLLWDLRVGATAAARILKHALGRWKPGFAAAENNRKLKAAGLPRGEFDAYSFAAMTYNWGGAAGGGGKGPGPPPPPKPCPPFTYTGGVPAGPFLMARDPRRMKLPSGPCRYATRFRRHLKAARRAGPPGVVAAATLASGSQGLPTWLSLAWNVGQRQPRGDVGAGARRPPRGEPRGRPPPRGGGGGARGAPTAGLPRGRPHPSGGPLGRLPGSPQAQGRRHHAAGRGARGAGSGTSDGRRHRGGGA